MWTLFVNFGVVKEATTESATTSGKLELYLKYTTSSGGFALTDSMDCLGDSTWEY